MNTHPQPADRHPSCGSASVRVADYWLQTFLELTSSVCGTPQSALEDTRTHSGRVSFKDEVCPQKLMGVYQQRGAREDSEEVRVDTALARFGATKVTTQTRN